MSKTNFAYDAVNPNNSTLITEEFMDRINAAVPTGEDIDGSLPLLYAVDSGAADVYVLTLTFGFGSVNFPQAYVAGQQFVFKATNANTGASTINVNAIGAKAIKRKDGSALQAGDILANDYYEIFYDGTNFLLFNGGYEPGIIQTVHTEENGYNTGSTVIPLDDTIPQNTEGNEFITASITPKNANHKLLIDVVIQLSSDIATPHHLIAALFKDSGADALVAVSEFAQQANAMINMRIAFEIAAGGTSSITFKIRAGSESAGTVRINGRSGGREFGGVSGSYIRITEIKG